MRVASDTTQRWRRAFQIAFLLLNVAIGIQFWFFVRLFESGGEGIYLPRPPGIEGWLPIAARPEPLQGVRMAWHRVRRGVDEALPSGWSLVILLV